MSCEIGGCGMCEACFEGERLAEECEQLSQRDALLADTERRGVRATWWPSEWPRAHRRGRRGGRTMTRPARATADQFAKVKG